MVQRTPDKGSEFEFISFPCNKYIILCYIFPQPDSQQTSSHDLQKQQMQLPTSDNFSEFHPTYPVFISQIRDQPLVSPPTEPPLPILQFPYYLGLKHRKRNPAEPTPPPTPPPVVPEFLKFYSPFAKTSFRCALSKSLFQSEDGRSESQKSSCEEKRNEEINCEVWMEYANVFNTFRSVLMSLHE